VGCDGCSHTGNILRVAKCATDRKCCSGRVGEKADQVQYALRHSHVFPVAVETQLVPSQTKQPHSRNRQKDHALHRRSAGNYVPVPTYFRGNLAFQRNVPCQHVHSFRVPIVTIFAFANFKTLGMKYQSINNNAHSCPPRSLSYFRGGKT